MATTAYTPKDWNTGDIIAETDLDHIEQGVKAAVDAVIDLEGAKITEVKAETLEAGQAATVKFESGVLTIGVPKGSQGGKGDPGEDGAAGAAGKQGASYRLSTETFAASKADCQASAVTPGASVLPIIVGDLIEDATKAVWQVTAVSGATFTVGAAAVRAAPAA